MKAVAIIPARWASSRFPGKPLAKLAGRSIIEHVWRAASQSGLFEHVIIATDDERIAEAVRAFSGEAVMTSPQHRSGSDRAAEVAAGLDVDVVVNIQGDEPFISAAPLKKLLDLFADAGVQVASLMHHMQDEAAFHDPNRVKVVCNGAGDALYFSRAPIPFSRDMGFHSHCFIHIGVYAYRRDALLRFVQMPHGRLEEIEKLEQLRLLEHGVSIRMARTDYTGMGVDTPKDLARAEEMLASK